MKEFVIRRVKDKIVKANINIGSFDIGDITPEATLALHQVAKFRGSIVGISWGILDFKEVDYDVICREGMTGVTACLRKEDIEEFCLYFFRAGGVIEKYDIDCELQLSASERRNGNIAITHAIFRCRPEIIGGKK